MSLGKKNVMAPKKGFIYFMQNTITFISPQNLKKERKDPVIILRFFIIDTFIFQTAKYWMGFCERTPFVAVFWSVIDYMIYVRNNWRRAVELLEK